MKDILTNFRFNFLVWLIIPIIGIWMAISYLIGIINQPSWQKIDAANDPSVLAARTRRAYTSQKPEKLKWDGSGLVTLWFDDAWISQFTVAYPKLDDMGYTGAIAVPTQSMGVDGYMGWAQLERLAYAHWEISSHTRTHLCNLTNLKPAEAISEIEGSKEDLEQYGYIPDIFVSPCGADSALWKDTVKKNYLALRGTEEGLNTLPVADPYYIKSRTMHNYTTDKDIAKFVKEAQDQKGWVILMFHQIDNSKGEYAVTPDMFSKMLQTIKDSNAKVVLPSQALNLVVENK